MYDFFNDFLIEQSIIKVEKNNKLMFDPYECSISSTNNNNKNVVNQMDTVNYEDLIKQERIRRNELIINFSKVERKIRIFILKEGQIFGNLIEGLNRVLEYESQEFIKENNKEFALRLIKENRENEKFKLKSRIEYEKLLNTPLHFKASIRIKFPNDTIIVQADFGLMEKVSAIYEMISSVIEMKSEEYYIFSTHPHKKYNDMNAIIRNEGLAPFVLLYIKFPNLNPMDKSIKYISKSALEKHYNDFHG